MDKKKLDVRTLAAVVSTVLMFAFQAYIALVKQFPPMLQSPLHLVFALTLVFIYFPADYNYRKKLRKAAEAKGETPDPVLMQKRAWMNWLDIPAFIGIAYLLWYVLTQNARLTDYVLGISPVYAIDYVCMVVTIVLLLLAVYRTLGMMLAAFITVFIIFAWTSRWLPGIFYTKPKSTWLKFLNQFTAGMTMTESGVFGTPLYTSASTLFYFMVFGAFFSVMGGGQLLIDLGMKLSNKSSGGPAKAAVLSSGLMGMISGSAVANVATTGVMTIPMMKKIGYEPEEAGAVEAVASTGGQIMPPIMGVGAFIMAEMLGINYMKVAAAAIIPAVAYYFAVFVLVDHIAAKRASRIDGTVDATIHVGRPILPRLYLLIPAALLVVWIIRGASLMRAGMIGIFACIACDVVSYFVNKEDFVDLKGLGACCMDGAKQAASIAIPTAACGIIINVVTGQTSLATNLSNLISALGTDNLFFALAIAMVGFMVPFVFVYNPAILLQGTIVEIVLATAQLALGTYFLAVMVAGFGKKELNKVERALLLAAALCLIAPEMISSIIGIVLGLGVLIINSRGIKKTPAAA